MNWRYAVFYMFLGWLVGWLLKYVIFGLRRWDSALHPERLQGDTTGPYSMFAEPLLGLLS